MKNKNKRANMLLRIIIITLIITQTNSPTLADVGSFQDYSSGGSSSGFSYSSSSSYSSSYSSSSSSDYSSGSSSRRRSSKDASKDPNFYMFMGIVTVFIIVTIIIGYKRKPKNHNKNVNRNVNKPQSITYNRTKVTYNNTGVVASLKKVDPNFNRSEFENYVKEIFIKLQNAWTEKNWEKIRPFESEELFEQHKAQLDGYIKNNQINVMEKISVNDINLISFEQTEKNDIIVLDLDSRMCDYIIDATTKAIIKGNKTKEYYSTYTLTFMRTNGNVTKKGEIEKKNCPNCGAPLTITSSGRCEYCNSVITTEDYSWVLTNLTKRI